MTVAIKAFVGHKGQYEYIQYIHNYPALVRYLCYDSYVSVTIGLWPLIPSRVHKKEKRVSNCTIAAHKCCFRSTKYICVCSVLQRVVLQPCSYILAGVLNMFLYYTCMYIYMHRNTQSILQEEKGNCWLCCCSDFAAIVCILFSSYILFAC